MIDKRKCISCGACVSLCPTNAISFDEDNKAQIDKSLCIKCHTCEAVCPVDAIKIKD